MLVGAFSFSDSGFSDLFDFKQVYPIISDSRFQARRQKSDSRCRQYFAPPRTSFISFVGVADDGAQTRLLQTSFLLLVALPVMVVFDSFLLQVLPDIVHPKFIGLLKGGDQSSHGRVRRTVGPKRPLCPKVSFQHLPPALASFSGFLVSLSTSSSEFLRPMAIAPDDIASPGIP